jgi:hypothetical protein
MADSHAIALDTPSEVRQLQMRTWAAASIARKAAMIEAMCRDTRRLALAGIRSRFPEASPREQHLRLGALTIERAIMIEAFDWDPDREGR